MTQNITERIDNAIEDIEIMQFLYWQKYGEECFADKEIAEVLKIAKVEHAELEQYRSIGKVEECREAQEKQKPMKMIPATHQLADTWIEYDCKCPVCGREWVTYLELGAEKYCFKCGQALEWSI